jgi:hypothetical protein
MKLYFLLGSVVALTSLGAAQTKKQTPAKPKGKPAQTRPTLGTVQLPGDNGQVNVAYSMGNKGDELNFTLDTAEFADRAHFADGTTFPTAEQKLLLLTFTVQNPQKKEMFLTWNTFKFTVVSPEDQNQEFGGYLYHPTQKTRYSSTLKPAQKVKATIAIPIHAVGPVNKLMVRRGEAPVLRYDLRSKVKPLTGPFATNEGIDIAKEGAGALNTPFGLGQFDWTIESVEAVEGPVGNYKARDGEKAYIVIATVKNTGLLKQGVTWNTLRPTMKDADGEQFEWKQDFLGMNSNKTIGTELEPNDTIRAKFVFTGPANAKPAKLSLLDNRTNRTLVIKL